MKRSIKSKILAATSLVVLVSLLISSTIAYVVFLNTLKEQMVEDDGARLMQTWTQMEYVADDIRKFSYNIALDSSVQAFLQAGNWASPLEELRSIESIRKKILEFAKLRDSIQRAAVVRLDGTVCTNLREFDEYTAGSLTEDWFQDFLRDPDRPYFSNPHETQSERSSVENVVSYVISVKDIDRPMQVIGYVVLNIYASQFLGIVTPQGDASEAYLWLGADNAAVFEKKTGNAGILPATLAGEAVSAPSDGPALIRRGGGYVLLTPPMDNGWRLASYTSDASLVGRTSNILVIFLLFIVASIVLTVSIVLPIVHGITKPITKLTRAMEEVSGGNMDAAVAVHSGDEVQVLGDGFNRMLSELKSYIGKSIRDEKTKRDMEFNLLLAQINPHFIYNTLNTVIYMARKRNDEDIAAMMDSFIRILQDAVKINEQGVYATMRQEVAVAGHYAGIQQFRYPGRFRVTFDMPEDLMDACVPKTLLQPLIENALLHGIFPSERDGVIAVTARRKEDALSIEVRDNGVGMDEESIGRLMGRGGKAPERSAMRGIGIPNIIERLRYLYGDGAGLAIDSSVGSWTRIAITLPFVKKTGENIEI